MFGFSSNVVASPDSDSTAAMDSDWQEEFDTCAFCYDPGGRTTVVCACKGGTQNVHLDCLDKWMDTGITECAACKQPYRDARRFIRLPRIMQFRRLRHAIGYILDLVGMAIGHAYAIWVLLCVGTGLMMMIRTAVLGTSDPSTFFDGLVAFASVVWLSCRYNIRIERNV